MRSILLHEIYECLILMSKMKSVDLRNKMLPSLVTPLLPSVIMAILILNGPNCAAEVNPLRNGDNHDSVRFADESQEANSFQYSEPTLIRLKRCEGLKVPAKLPEIPIFSFKSMDYKYTKFVFDGLLRSCPFGGSPVVEHSTLSFLEYAEYISDAESPHELIETQYTILRAKTLLIEEGILSTAYDQTAHFYKNDDFCVSSIEQEQNHTILNLRTCPVNPARPVFPKCCMYGQIMENEDCVYGKAMEPEYLDEETLKPIPIRDTNPVYISPLLKCKNPDEKEHWESDGCGIVFHPVTNSRIVFIDAHRKWEYLSPNRSVCFDTVNGSDGVKRFALIHCSDNDTSSRDKERQARISVLYMISMYVGSVFHLGTTLVYLITWKKQNIHGKTLSSCTASLFFMQIFLGTAHLLGKIGNQRNSTWCYVNGVAGHYFMIASFTWLLVVNIDLWRTFRSIRSDGNHSLKRFLAYSSLGWGFPLLVSITSIALELTFKCRKTFVPIPEFGEHYCFVSPWTQGYYVYYILTILITLSIIFAVLTLFGLYNFKKDTGNLRSSKRAADHQNVLLFLKLGVVMGFSWIFEIISWAVIGDEEDNHPVWIIFDLYNALSAILIFLIFVCKRNTLNLLEQSIPALKGVSAAYAKFTSTFRSEEASSNSNHTASTGGGTSVTQNEKNQSRKKSMELKPVRLKQENNDYSTNNRGFD